MREEDGITGCINKSEGERRSELEKILLFPKLLLGNVVTNTVPTLPVVYETGR